MTLEIIQATLGWCSLINTAILLWWFLILTIAHDLTYKWHSKIFKISEEKFDSINYAGIAIFKISILMFNIVPYLALRIVG